MGILTILWEKWVEFRRDFYKITLAAMIAPLMYLIVFGMGIQTSSHGEPYLNFLIPGVVSLTTMNGSFNAIAQNLNVQRLYEKAFDQVMISPTPLWQFIAGQIIGGSLRGLYAGGIILLLTMPIGTGLVFNGWSLLVMFLNGAVFSAIGVVVSFLAKNHADVPGFFVQHLLLYREDPGFSWEFCSCSSTVTDQSSDPYHCFRRWSQLPQCPDPDSLSNCIQHCSFLVYL